MKETTITLPMGKADLQEAATAVIEQLATAPPDTGSMSQEQSISYNMGLSILLRVCAPLLYKHKVSPFKKILIMIQLTKQSSDSEIKAYFIQVLNLSRSKEEFPVNLDEVWPLVFKFRSDAVRALSKNNLFVKDIDYQVLSTNAQKSGVFPQNAQKSEVFAKNGKKSGNTQEEGKSVMGRPQNTYMLSVPCLEFFIARRVRPVFEVYRQVFHKVAGGGISLGNQVFQSVHMSLEETLAPLARYNAMIEDRFDIVRGVLINAGIEDGDANNPSSLAYTANACRIDYQAYRNCINKLVYVETAFKLEGATAFSPYGK